MNAPRIGDAVQYILERKYPADVETSAIGRAGRPREILTVLGLCCATAHGVLRLNPPPGITWQEYIDHQILELESELAESHAKKHPPGSETPANGIAKAFLDRLLQH